MNKGLLIVFILYLLQKSIELVLEILNLRYLSRHGSSVPAGFQKHVDEEALKKMKDYSLEHGKLSILTTIYGTIITAVFVFGGLFEWYNGLFAASTRPLWFTGTLFFLFLTYAETVLTSPFSLYSTFHIEKKYGFTTQSIGLWFADLAKTLIISTILYGVLVGSAFYFIRTFPESWWLIVWAFFFFFSLVLLYIAPYVIEPLFNKFDPIKDSALEESIRNLMEKAGLSISRVYTMDASKRSTHSNAYFNGIGRVKRIVLFDTLIKNNTTDELLAILAHEAGHWKKKHIIKRLALTEIIALLIFFLAYHAIEGSFLINLFQISNNTDYGKLLIFAFLASIAFFPLTPLGNWFSRYHEWEADRFAVQLTSAPLKLAEALMKLSKDNLSNLHPHPLYASFYYSHPPIVKRVRLLMESGKTKI